MAASQEEFQHWRDELPHEMPAPGARLFDPLMYDRNPLTGRVWAPPHAPRPIETFLDAASVEWDSDASTESEGESEYAAVGHGLLKLHASDGDVTEHVEMRFHGCDLLEEVMYFEGRMAMGGVWMAHHDL